MCQRGLSPRRGAWTAREAVGSGGTGGGPRSGLSTATSSAHAMNPRSCVPVLLRRRDIEGKRCPYAAISSTVGGRPGSGLDCEEDTSASPSAATRISATTNVTRTAQHMPPSASTTQRSL